MNFYHTPNELELVEFLLKYIRRMEMDHFVGSLNDWWPNKDGFIGPETNEDEHFFWIWMFSKYDIGQFTFLQQNGKK